jgi:hypothetical protein
MRSVHLFLGLASWAGLAGLLSFGGCVREDAAANVEFGPSASDSRYSGSTPAVALPEIVGEASVTVPPDLAAVALQLTADAPGFGPAGERARTVGDEVLAAVRAQEGCSGHWVDQTPATRVDDDTWRGFVQLQLDVALSGLADTRARAERIDACLGALAAPATAPGVHVMVSAPLVSVEDPSAHQAELLERRIAAHRKLEQRTASAGPGVVPATCRSNGEVVVVARHLAGVVLAIDWSCDGTPPVAA